MRQEEETYFAEEEMREIVRRFEEMEQSNAHSFFDVHELEQIADYYIDDGSYHHAFEAVNFGLVQHPDSIPLQIKKAQILLHQRKLSQSLALLDQLSRIEFTNVEIFISMGMVYDLMNKKEKASQQFEKAISLEQEEKDEIASQIAFSMQERENFEEAIRFFHLALKYNPQRTSCFLELGNCYQSLFIYGEAEKYYKKFLDVKPFSYRAWFSLGVVLKYQNRVDESLASMDFSLAINEQYGNALLFKANLLYSLDRYEEAIENYRSVLIQVPNDVLALVSLADCYISTDLPEKAIKHLIHAEKIDPSYHEIFHLLGIAEQNLGRPDQGITYLKKACSLEPDDASVWYSLAGCYTDSGKFREASRALQKAIRKDPADLEYREALAKILRQEGKYLKAADILEEGIGFSEPDAWFLYFLGTYRILGHEIKEGLRVIDKALQLNFKIHEKMVVIEPEVFNTREVLQLIAKYQNKKS